MGQAKPPTDQATTREHVLDFFGGRAGGDVEIFGGLAEQQVANTAADDERLETRLLQFAHDISCVRAKLFQPDSVFGLGNSNEFFDDGLRFVTG
jgi:hypothetical protein